MTPKKQLLVGRILSGIAILPFLPGAIMMLMKSPQVTEGMAHLGLPESLIVPIGAIKVLCLIAYLTPRTAVVGAILLTGYMGGAIMTHLRVGEPPVMQVILPILLWAGLYLREPRLRPLMPLRQPA